MSENPPTEIPTFEQRAAMWKALDFPAHEVRCPHAEAYAAALRSRYSNGRVILHSFSIPEHPIFDWYLDRNRFHDVNFFERFWTTPTPAAILKQRPAELNYYEMSLFEWSTPFQLAGYLSSILFSGGAYSCSTGYGLDARRLGDAAAAELLNEDYEETLFFHCQSAWSDFFCDVAWDFTFIVVSKSRRLLHVLLATDTD